MQYLNFDVEISAGRDQDYLVIVHSPAGETRSILHLPWSSSTLDHLLNDLNPGKQPAEQSLQDFGQQLFEALFRDEVRSRYSVTQAQAADQAMGVRIRLCLLAPELAALPWEYLYDPRKGEYCCLSGHTPLVRYMQLPQPIKPLRVKPPLQILGMVANPSDQAPLHTEQERQRIQHALQPLVERGLAQLSWLEGQTWRDLQRAMRGGPWHIFHFIGHGRFDETTQEGFLVMANDTGTSHPLQAQQVSRLLVDHGSLRVVVLNASEGARGSATRVFSSTAATMTQQGISAVLAMQSVISDKAAIEFSRSFYEALADGLPVDGALAEARKAVSIGITKSPEWGIPILYLRAADGALFHLSAQARVRKSISENVQTSQISTASSNQNHRPNDVLPERPPTPFQPRPGEFEKLEHLLFGADNAEKSVRMGLVGVVGMGGLGKTRLALELAYRIRDRFPSGVFWMTATGKSQGEWQRDLAELARRSGYLPPDDQPGHPENEERWARHLARYLTHHADALLILDNVEDPNLIVSILPALADRSVNCKLLYTSRLKLAPREARTYSVEALSTDGALRLLLADIRPAVLHTVNEGSQNAESLAAQSLCALVGSLPLGLVHLRRLLERDPMLSVVQLDKGVRTYGALEIAQSEDGDVQSLFAVFDYTWRQVHDQDARRLFLLASFFPEARPIPLWLLGLAAGLGEHWEPWEPLGKARLRLQDCSLLEIHSVGQIRLHPLVREFAQRLLRHEPDQGQRLVQETGERLSALFTDLGELERRARKEGYEVCLEQVRAALVYMTWLGSDQARQLGHIERWLDRESYLFANTDLWPERLPGLFYQQFFNQTVEDAQPVLEETTPAHWIKQIAPVGARDQSLRRIFAGHLGWVNSVAFAPDGQHILTGSDDKTARLWETATGKLVTTLEGHQAGIRSVAFAPDGQHILTGSDDKTVRLWETATGRFTTVLKAHQRGVRSVAFSPDSQQILTGSSDQTICLWETSTGELVRIFSTHPAGVRSVAFAPDGQHILSGSVDCIARLWETATGRIVTILEGHQAPVTSVAFAPDGQQILTGSTDKTARLWETATGRIVTVLEGHQAGVTSVVFAPDGQHILTGSDDKTARLWETSTGKLVTILEGHQELVRSVAFAPDGQHILTGSADKTARLWGTATGKLVTTLEGHRVGVTGVAFAPDGRHLLTGSVDRIVRLWETSTGKLVTILEGHQDWVRSVAFAPDGQHILTGSDDRTARLWETSTGKLVTILEGHQDWVKSVAFAPDGQHILTGSDDRTARLWETSTGKLVTTLEGHHYWINSVVFAPDSQHILTGSDDKTARLWETATGKLMTTLEGHRAGVTGVAFAPDGQHILTGSADKTARLWETATGKLMTTLEGHRAGVTGVAFAPHGRLALTFDNAGWVCIWGVDLTQTDRLLGLFVASYPILSIHWSREGNQIFLADGGGLRGWPYIYQLKLVGI